MPKRGRSPSEAAHAVPSKQNVPQRIILCGIYDEGKTAVAKSLLKELNSATVIACDLKAGRRAVPKQSGEFEVRVSAPQLQTQDLLNVVVLSHVLAQPSLVAAAMARANSAVRLLTVLDARSFLDEWESPEELPLALREAAKTDARAHMRDKKKASEVLAECVESADVIALSHADAGDGDELEMLEAMLRELNPSAAIVRRDGDGEGGGKILKHVRASPECPAPNRRSGCWQAILAARKQGTGEEGGAEDEDEQEGEEEEDGESDCESDEYDEHNEGDGQDEGDEGEGDGGDEGDEDDEVEVEWKQDGEGEEVEEANEDWVAPVVSRFAFLARRPFHPARLHKLLKRGQLDGVIRSNGVIWVATHPEDGIVWNQV